jgi:hypothetical protein
MKSFKTCNCYEVITILLMFSLYYEYLLHQICLYRYERIQAYSGNLKFPSLPGISRSTSSSTLKPAEDVLSQSSQKMILSLLKREPSQRLTADGILLSDWITL